MKRVAIVGAGMGGLSAAIRLARNGCTVEVVEARISAGGLAAGFEQDGFAFDYGPYILLDRPGLEWALGQLEIPNAIDRLELRPIEDVYEVRADDSPAVRIRADLDATAEGMERDFPGSAVRYRKFVARVVEVHRRLLPLLVRSRPRARDVLLAGALPSVPFLLRSLGSVLAQTGLPEPIRNALGIWTHIAGQPLGQAPSPLAFVPGLIHTVGCFYPRGGIRAVPALLVAEAKSLGVRFRFGTAVRRIRTVGGRAVGVELENDEFLPADAVISNASAIATHLRLVEIPAAERATYDRLPLQSPGATAYLAIREEKTDPPYLRFRLPPGELCELLVRPAVVVPGITRDGWAPARLIAPMRHVEAERDGGKGQDARLQSMLESDWWRTTIVEHKVVRTRIPQQWGRDFNLWRDSMNPVMTARFMRRGRIAHRSPHVDGLYLAGSSTHPGQWVSFCAISGVLAADRLIADLG